MQEVERVKSLSEKEKENIGLANAITEGFTGDYVDVEVLQKKWRS